MGWIESCIQRELQQKNINFLVHPLYELMKNLIKKLCRGFLSLHVSQAPGHSLIYLAFNISAASWKRV